MNCYGMRIFSRVYIRHINNGLPNPREDYRIINGFPETSEDYRSLLLSIMFKRNFHYLKFTRTYTYKYASNLNKAFHLKLQHK
jgi:hypothetical protein